MTGPIRPSARLDALFDAARLSLLIALPMLAIYFFLGTSEQAVATYFLVLLVGALGFASFTALSGILSFGHVAFMGIAAHLSALLTMPPALKGTVLPNLPGWLVGLELPFLASVAITLVVVGTLALIVGLPISRLGGSEAAIATLGLLMIGYSVIVGARDFTRGSQAMFGVPKDVTLPVALIFAVLTIAVVRVYAASRAGLLMRAVREDEPAAAAVGIRPARIRLITWTLSAVVAGLAGILLGHYLTVFSPKEFYFDLTFGLLVVLILGGFASISGAVIGSAAVTLLVELLRRVEQSASLQEITGTQVFGLTEVGLSLTVLWMLYRHNEGLFGHRELSDVLRTGNRVAATEGSGSADRPDRRPEVELVVAGLSKSYGGVIAVEDVSLQVRTGEILGLIGPNGSGKTTLLGCIAGTHSPDQGQVLLAGKLISDLASDEVARAGIGRTFQTIRLFGRLSVLDNVAAAMAATHPVLRYAEVYAKAGTLLSLFGISDLGERQASTLAYGQQRRLEIARAMALDPDILLLDEPAAGMNKAESDELLSTLESVRRDYGVGIVVVDHDLRLIMRLCDRIIVLNKGGVIAEGTPEAVQGHPEVRAAYLGGRASGI